MEDALLNVQIKERIKLFDEVVKLYIENKSDEEVLANANWILNEAIVRLWAQKHKEMGRFASILFKLIETLIDNVSSLIFRIISINRNRSSLPFASRSLFISRKRPL